MFGRALLIGNDAEEKDTDQESKHVHAGQCSPQRFSVAHKVPLKK
jgi:hypothetical protein